MGAAADLGELAGPLRAALEAASYRHDPVTERLGPTAHAALGRSETTPALRATTAGEPLDVLIRLWLLQTPVPLEHAERALPGLVDRLCTAGLLERSVAEVAARVDVRPYAADDLDLWIASDLTPGLDGGPSRVGPDHVLGISSATTSLAQLTVRRPVGRALDLGTGSGVQALHLAAHAGAVVGTDVNRRALWLARLNAALAGADVDLREGSYFRPVHGERFDLIVTNPPFVISPGAGERLVYRDSGLPGDRVVEDIVRGAPAHLAEGGVCQLLGNWMIPDGAGWQERIAEWIDPAVDAWVVQRERVDVAAYVELWLKDAGLHGAPEYHDRYDTWLSWFADQGVSEVGFGWITLRATTDAITGPASVRIEEWPYDVAQPLGTEVAEQLDRATLLRGLDDALLLDRRWRRRADVVQETVGEPGAADPGRIVLRQQAGMRRARAVDTAEAALVGACDGDLSARQILAAIEQLGVALPDEPAALVRGLVEDGFLTAA